MKTKLLILPIMFLLFSVHAFSIFLVADNAGLLSTSEKASLITLTDSIAATYNFDLVIVTETDIGDTNPGNYAADFFDNNGYGLGSGRDGCLFLQVTESQDYWFSTSGRGVTVLNPYAFQKLRSDTVKHLGEDNSYAAFRAFIQDWDKFLSLEAKGRNYNFFYQWNIILVLIGWLAALGIGFLIVRTWNRGMNTALPKTQAAVYTVSGSLNYKKKKDSFLHSTVNKTKLQTQSSTSAGAAGSGLRVSSSGRSHGGGGGKYRSKR
jgi:uncharacterized protein